MSKPRLPKATGSSLLFDCFSNCILCQMILYQNATCLKHYQIIIMKLTLKNVSQSHCTSLKIRTVYIQIDQQLCIFSYVVSIFYIIKY